MTRKRLLADESRQGAAPGAKRRHHAAAPAAMEEVSRQSTVDSEDGDDSDGDESSVVSTSSSESSSGSDAGSDQDEDEDEDEDEVVTLAPSKPRMQLPRPSKDGISSLLARARSFLPELENANEVLRAELEAGKNVTMETADGDEGVEGEGEYIELDLGLGVLEEKRDGGEEEEESEGEDEDGERDHLGELLGARRTKEKGEVGIEVLEDG